MIIEFIGVAGSGKTTISQYLSNQNQRIHRCDHPNPRSLYDLPFFFINFQRLWRYLSKSKKLTENKTRRDLAWMAVLLGWSDRLLKEYPQTDAAILDQGPVYLIAELQHFNPNGLENSLQNEWWFQIFDRWSASLDMIVWFDAPNEILAGRISGRTKWHMIKNKPENEVFKVLDYHRAFYQEVITFFEIFGSKPRLLRINSGYDELSVISAQLIQAFGL